MVSLGANLMKFQSFSRGQGGVGLFTFFLFRPARCFGCLLALALSRLASHVEEESLMFGSTEGG